MKRKKIIAAVILFGCLLLGGCDQSEDIKIYGRSSLDDNDTYIQMDTKYKLKGYDKEYSENGCIVHIYYET